MSLLLWRPFIFYLSCTYYLAILDRVMTRLRTKCYNEQTSLDYIAWSSKMDTMTSSFVNFLTQRSSLAWWNTPRHHITVTSNGRDSVSNHQPHDCLLDRLLRLRSKKTSKLCVTGLCARNSPGAGELPAQMARYSESVSIWWRHHGIAKSLQWRRMSVMTYYINGNSTFCLAVCSGNFCWFHWLQTYNTSM